MFIAIVIFILKLSVSMIVANYGGHVNSGKHHLLYRPQVSMQVLE